jgi:hypothetical protein
MILVAFLIPIVLAAVNYATKRVEQSHRSTVKKSAIYAVAQAVLEKYNPGKTFNAQRLMLFTAAAQALNDRAFDLKKDMHTAHPEAVTLYAASATTVASASLTQMYRTLSSQGLKNNSAIISKDEDYGSLLCDEDPVTDVVFDPSTAQISYKMINTDEGTVVRNVVCYDPDEDDSTEGKPKLTLNTTDNRIECEVLGKKVSAIPAECNVDIVLTLPTNQAACTAAPVAPIVLVAKAYAKFLKENFLHTRGTAVALVPYSAKISVPPDKSSWTVAIPPMNQLPDKPYLKQAIAYGTEGKIVGGEIVSNSTNIQYEWGNENPNIGFPIMFRRGASETYRGTRFYTGTGLLSTANPNSDSLKFQRMNPNPCYLGHCNLLASCCETNCPIYLANPYFITELTDNIPDVIHDLGLIRPINDPKNKSNFLFLAVQWAQMLLFEDWTDHPSDVEADPNQKFEHPDRDHKKKAIIFVINSPDRFEPRELTYLGFNNDASEIPMFESDTINSNYNYGAPTNDARTSPVKSTKGTLVYSGTGTYNTTSGTYVVTSGAGKLTFPQKGMLKIVVAASQSTSSCSFTNINNVSRRIEFGGANVAPSLTQNTSYTITGTKTFYLTPDQISDVPDANENYYVNFSLANVRLVSAEITNRPTETVIPTVQMYEGSEQKTLIDCAASDAGNTNKTVTFIVNTKVPFTVRAKVPYAWISTTDFRQTSGDAVIFSNDNTHPFRINVAVPSSTTDASVSPNNTLTNGAQGTDNNSVIVTAKRKLSSFTLKGNYNYVSQETWEKSYISRRNYTRSDNINSHQIVFFEDIPGCYKPLNKSFSKENGQIIINIKSFQCGSCSGGCSAGHFPRGGKRF